MAVNEEGVCDSAGSALQLPPSAGFCKLPSSFHLMQPSYPLLQAMRHLGRISAAFLPVPAGGPRRRVCEAWPHRPSPPEAGGSARLGGTGSQFPGLRLTLKWGKSGEASLAQPDVHPSKLPLRGILSCSSPGRRSTRGGVGARGGRLYMQRSPSGAVGQVGAVLSAPVSQPPPQMPTKPPHPKACRVAPLGPSIPGPRNPATE